MRSIRSRPWWLGSGSGGGCGDEGGSGSGGGGGDWGGGGGGRGSGGGDGSRRHGAQPLGPAPVGRPAALRKPAPGESAVGAPPADDVFSDRLFLALPLAVVGTGHVPGCRGLVFGLGIVLGVGAAAAGGGAIRISGLAAAVAGEHLRPGRGHGTRRVRAR